MLIYLDESYDNAHAFFLLGALFVPKSKPLHSAFRQAKIQEGYLLPDGQTREVKYSQLRKARDLRVAQAGIEAFLASGAWFRCVVVDQRPEMGWSLDFFGTPDEGRALKEARAYKKFTEMLLRDNRRGVSNAVLLADQMTRCAGDEFIGRIADEFGQPRGEAAPMLRSVQQVDTALEDYQVGQIGDLLTGAVLNELVVPQGKSARYKRQFREYAKARLGIPSLGRDYWSQPRYGLEREHPEFQVRHWRPTRRPQRKGAYATELC